MDESDKIDIIKFMDDVRYKKDNIDAFKFETSYDNDISKYFDINDGKCTYKDSLTYDIAEEILLTHYLIYVCNKQMKYQNIIKDGGKVISKLVKTYMKEKSVESVLQNHINKDKCCFYAETNEFSSRFCPTDIISVLRTLFKLEKTKKPFAQFLNEKGDDIYKLAEEMYNLTYNVKQKLKKEDIKNLCLSELSNDNKWCKNNKFDRYHAKRIWCVLRDFLYHPYFSECYRRILKKGGKEFEAYSKEQIPKLELPGDVWNNNKKFAECFWGEHKKDMSKYVRDKLEKLEVKSCFPTNFDITFLFVPNMCNQEKCSLCPFKTNLNDICHKVKGVYCSFFLYSTGIKYKCPEDENQCKLRTIMKM